MKTFSSPEIFFLVGVEVAQFTPSSSKVTIFSRLLVAVPEHSNNLGWFDDAEFDAEPIGGVRAEEGRKTDEGGGGGTAMSVTAAAARLNSLTLLGTKYSKCRELSCWRCWWCWWWYCVGDKQLRLRDWARWNCWVDEFLDSDGVFFRGREWWPGDGFMAVLDAWARSFPSPGLLAWCCQEVGTMDMAIASSSCSDNRESLVPPPSSRSALSPGPAPDEELKDFITFWLWWIESFRSLVWLKWSLISFWLF